MHRPASDRTRDQVQADIQDAVGRIVHRVNPQRIILFGSHARGSQHSDSDIDLLVVLDEMPDKGRALVELLDAVNGVWTPIDVIPTSPEEIQQRGDLIGDVLRPALHEGKVVYERT